jgi:uncharacterized protein (DUF433 family)
LTPDFTESPPMSIVAYPHIEISDGGVPILSGTTTKVVEIVLDRIAHHWDADEIRRQHPHLSLSQIYAALTYYHDHQSEIDAEISQQLDDVERIRQAQGESAMRLKLKQRGLIP